MKTLPAFKEIEDELDEFEFEDEDDDAERLREKESRSSQLARDSPWHLLIEDRGTPGLSFFTSHRPRPRTRPRSEY